MGLQLYEVAERLGIPRSATHRLLPSLSEHGYVSQDRLQGTYQLTAKIASLAFTYLSRSGITDFAQPVLDRLATESGELVRLAVISGQELIWVAKAQGSPPACAMTLIWGRWRAFRAPPAGTPGSRALRTRRRVYQFWR